MTLNTPQEKKKALRAAGKAARRALSAEYRAAASAAICARILASAAWRDAKTVLVFRAFDAEVELDGLTDAARAQGKTLAWPYCVGAGGMKALVPRTGAAWSTDYYGIAAPDPAQADEALPASLDLVLTPLVAFDAACRRIGMGAGIYDRFLPRCTRAAKLGVAFDAQAVPPFEAEATDVPLDGLFTEVRFYPATAGKNEKEAGI